jgi:hypothetical protein
LRVNKKPSKIKVCGGFIRVALGILYILKMTILNQAEVTYVGEQNPKFPIFHYSFWIISFMLIISSCRITSFDNEQQYELAKHALPYVEANFHEDTLRLFQFTKVNSLYFSKYGYYVEANSNTSARKTYYNLFSSFLEFNDEQFSDPSIDSGLIQLSIPFVGYEQCYYCKQFAVTFCQDTMPIIPGTFIQFAKSDCLKNEIKLIYLLQKRVVGKSTIDANCNNIKFTPCIPLEYWHDDELFMEDSLMVTIEKKNAKITINDTTSWNLRMNKIGIRKFRNDYFFLRPIRLK